MQPPIAERRPTTTDLQGEAMVDEYGWLRNREDPAVVEYLEAENEYVKEVMAPTADLQELLYREMLGRIKETDVSVPYRKGDWWYYSRTEEGSQYGIHCRRRGSMEEGEEEVILDVNELAEGKEFMALGSMTISDDGWLLAYSTDETGFRQYTLKVLDLRSGEHLDLSVERVTSVTWDAGDKVLWYGVEDPQTKRSHQVWSRDVYAADSKLVFEEPDETMNVGVGRSRSMDWLLIECSSHTTSECRVRRAGSEDDWRIVLPRIQNREYDLVHHGEHFYLRVNDTGRNFRLVRIPTAGGALEAAEEILPHRAEVMLEGHEAFAGHLVLHEREGGLPQIAIRSFGDNSIHRIEFPEPTYLCHAGANPEFESDSYRFGYQSLVTPVSIYNWDIKHRQRKLLKQREVLGGFDGTEYESRRIEATADDGTKVPISLVRRKDRDDNRPSPCLIHGYGSYGYPYPVVFSSNQLSLLDRGVVVALAHVRGGGELGKPWHDAGRMANKVNSFTDFIAVADRLSELGIAAPDRIAIEGGSAGGLLMGAVVNMAPTKFAAVVSHVPFVDVLNTMSDPTLPLTIGEYEEWGNPGEPEQRSWIREYCPYSNLVPGPYPPMLVKTSFNDSQVMYWEPAKYVARIRALRTDDSPLLFHTNMGAGHGGASGRYDKLREVALDYAFLLATLRVEGELAGPSGS